MDIPRADWPRLLQLLDVLLEQPPEQQATSLAALQGDDARLRETLRELLAERDAMARERFLTELPALPPAPSAATAADERTAQRVGPWQLQRELGRGGMSVVWLAVRAESPDLPPVALKLPLVDPLRAALLAERFARERDILLSLQHPGIAAVRDAGVSDGQPWLALEPVDGRPITEDAAARGLSAAARLRLFLQVLDAVGHAHAQLVIHRDIKPANVLVDRAGQVKLLDFGVAKLLAEAEASAPPTALTQWGGRAMTPQYASPEQIGGAPLGTATDLYSLGVLLYELLTGRLPYRLARATPGAIEQAILEGGITLPSMAAAPAERRALRGDIDAIVTKALALKPAERYRSAEAFAEDIRRHLESRPVLARPAGLAYRMGRTLRRHAWGFATAAALLVALGAGAAATLWQARIAQQQAARANAVQRFVLDIFRHNSVRQSDPERARATTARELLAIGAERLDSALADNPQAAMEVNRVLAQMHSELGLSERAAELRRQAVVAAEKVYGPRSPELVAALVEWAVDLHHVGRLDERRAALQRALAMVRDGPDRASPQRAELYRRLSELEQSGQTAEARRWAALAVADAERLDDDDERWRSYETAATERHLAGDDAAAVPLYERGLAAAARCRCVFPGEQVRARVQMAEALNQLLQPAAAEAALRQALADSRRYNGEKHLDTVQTTLRLAAVLSLDGDPRAALALLQPLVPVVDGPDGVDEFSAPQVFNSMGSAWILLGRYDAAEPLSRRAIELRDRGRANSPFAATLRETLARALIGAGRLAEAEAQLLDAERIHRGSGAKPGEGRWARLAVTWLRLHLARGDVAAAERRAAEMPPGVEAGGVPGINGLERSLLHAELDLEAGRDAQAAQRLQAVQAVLLPRQLAPQLPLVEAQRRHVCGRWALRRAPGRARAHFAASHALRLAQLGPDAPATREAAEALARAPAAAEPASAGAPTAAPC